MLKKVGWGSGFGERVGWNLGEVREWAGWWAGGRVGRRGNCTISQFYIRMNVNGTRLVVAP
jgi:hypothetical protein